MKAPKSLPLKSLVFRPGNRESIDQAELNGLKDSIIERGVLQPILVREGKKGKYEIIAGERRVRACRLIDPDGHIAGIVMSCNDQEAEAICLVENLQRADLTPWEEATHLAKLKELNPEARVEDLAVQVGKSAPWVAQRLSFSKLLPGLKAIVAEQNWPIGHVALLARLLSDMQEKMLGFIKKGQREGYHQWAEWDGRKHAPCAPSLQYLRGMIKEFQHQLASAKWRLNDAELVPAAGACDVCPKRSSQQAMLFQEPGDVAKDDQCLDPECWGGKTVALVKLSIEKLKARHEGVEPVYLGPSDGKMPQGMKGDVKSVYNFQTVKKDDKGAIPAVFVDGDRAGETCYVAPPMSHGQRLKESRKAVNQETGKAEPPSNKDRIRKLRDKREAMAVVLWQERLETLKPKHVTVFALAVAMGTKRRHTSRLHDGNVWHEYRDCPIDLPKLGARLWQEVCPVLVERLKLYGSVGQEIKELWTEASKQAVALDAEEEFQQCYAQAANEIQLPKNLEKAGVADPDQKLMKKAKVS